MTNDAHLGAGCFHIDICSGTPSIQLSRFEDLEPYKTVCTWTRYPPQRIYQTPLLSLQGQNHIQWWQRSCVLLRLEIDSPQTESSPNAWVLPTSSCSSTPLCLSPFSLGLCFGRNSTCQVRSFNNTHLASKVKRIHAAGWEIRSKCLSHYEAWSQTSAKRSRPRFAP